MAYGINAPFGLAARFANGQAWNGQLTEALIYPGTLSNGIYSQDPVIKHPVKGIDAYYTADEVTNGVFPFKQPVGVFVSCQYSDANNNEIYAASFAKDTVTYNNDIPVKCLLITSPQVLYDIQSSVPYADTPNFGLTVTDIGLNANLAVGGDFTQPGGGFTYAVTGKPVQLNPTTGNPTTGLSAYYLDALSVTSTSDAVQGGSAGTNLLAPLKIVGFTQSMAPGQVPYVIPTTNPAPNTALPIGAFNNVIVSLNTSVFNGPTSPNVVAGQVRIDMNWNTFSGLTSANRETLAAGAPGILFNLTNATLIIYGKLLAVTGGSDIEVTYDGVADGGIITELADAADVKAAFGAAVGVKTVFTAPAGANAANALVVGSSLTLEPNGVAYAAVTPLPGIVATVIVNYTQTTL